MVCIDHSWPVHSFANGYSRCFHVWANNAFVNISGKVTECPPSPLGARPRSTVPGPAVAVVSYWALRTVFPGTAPCDFPPATHRSPFSPGLTHTSSRCLGNSYSHGFGAVSQCGWNMTLLSIFSRAYWPPNTFLGEMSTQVLPPFLYGVVYKRCLHSDGTKR